MKNTLFVPNKESKEDWLRTSIFYSICNIGGKVCNLIINRGNNENMVELWRIFIAK